MKINILLKNLENTLKEHEISTIEDVINCLDELNSYSLNAKQYYHELDKKHSFKNKEIHSLSIKYGNLYMMFRVLYEDLNNGLWNINYIKSLDKQIEISKDLDNTNLYELVKKYWSIG